MKFRSITLLASASALLGGCNYQGVPDPSVSQKDAQYLALVPKVQGDIQFERYRIDDPTGEAPGTIVVDTKDKYLYFVEPGRKAIRYGVATGQEAYGWTGVARVAKKADWPHLAPTARAGGLPGGPDNPLGSRALYLFQGNKDTMYRIHGTNEPESIGRGVSSGCIRMRDIDAIDLYNRVKVGTKVVVK